MGLAKLNVWVHDQLDPCKISDMPWNISVTYCNGNAVEWCGQKYSNVQAPCGHAEFTLPPGCYIVRGFTFVLVGKLFLFLFTEHAIAIVNCDQEACVHLYIPTFRSWPGGSAGAIRYLAQREKLPQDKVDQFLAAADALVQVLPETALDRAFTKLLEDLTDTLQKNPPKG
jgi:hypothetical protein